MNFELNTIYTLTTENGIITPDGRKLIEAFIGSMNLLAPEWKELNRENGLIYLPALPDADGFSWCWNVAKGDYRGTFPKRVSKWYKLNHSLNCPQSFLEKLGNIARQHSLEAYTYTFDIVNDFDWDAGDFGDSGSCFWSDRNEAREILEENGCLAIRFFDPTHGFARAWLYPADDFYVVFNGYGLTTLETAKIFATWQRLDYKKITLYNNNESGGTIWINGSGTGYVVGEADKIVISRYDFSFHTPNCCERCGTDIGENSYTTPDGEEYCGDCFYDHYDYCHECDDAFRRDDMTYIEGAERDVCDSCLRRHYTLCDHCGEYRHDSEVIEDKQGRAICEGCREE